MNALGLVNLILVTKPTLKTVKNNSGGTIEYWELTLTDGNLVFNRITGDSKYDFSNLIPGSSYSFAIIPRVKNINAVAQNGNQYNKAYADFKIVGVYDFVDVSKLKELIVMK